MKAECDIILLSYESPELLKRCVESVLEHTTVPSRLIVVDNASGDPEVARYLQGLHGRDNVSVEKVFSEENAGFAPGMNKGMRLSEAPFLCLLNNDCVVTKNWLEEMIAVARSRDDIGLVNPQSNTFGSTPDGKASINDHAALISDRKGRFVELGHAIAFACLIKREVVEAVGYLDEAYQGVCYEDTDFSSRARKNGFISVMAEGAYVFHEEQASRRSLQGKEEIYARNREIYERRWGRLLRVFYVDSSPQDRERVSAEYESLKGLVREGAIVEMRVRKDRLAGKSGREFEVSGAVRHADIGIKALPGDPVWAFILWRVITKKKKFDAIIMDDGFFLRFLRLLKFAHKAEVFSRKGSTGLGAVRGRAFDLKEPSEVTKFLRK